ncbi:hypothetical protein PBI_DEWDROP_71 [Microbacterium phage Dewdrop]|nr:hypothetical protein PBI_LEAF_71 [Microbacterium phage Leaf]QGZ17439.1 hypothetical protein PBI_DEWDROP_71 [Microbacterium phage Dewdrop]
MSSSTVVKEWFSGVQLVQEWSDGAIREASEQEAKEAYLTGRVVPFAGTDRLPAQDARSIALAERVFARWRSGH